MKIYASRVMSNYRIIIKSLLICCSMIRNGQAQEVFPNSTEYTWGSRLVNHQTTAMPDKGQTIIYVVHYFAPVSTNGSSDLFGIYGTANIQMGAEYGFSKNFSAFFFTEKINKTQELGVHCRFVRQSRSPGSPVSVAAAFSVSADARDKKYFGENYYFIDRLFYTTQLCIDRQIGYRWEIMVNGTFCHFNLVPESTFSTFLSFNPAVAFKLNRKVVLFGAFDFPLGVASASESNPQEADPLMTFGTVLRTPTHNFQLFVTNGSAINSGKEYLNNHSGFDPDAWRLGFNIQVKLGNRHR